MRLPARAEELRVAARQRTLVRGAQQVRAVDQRALVVEDRRLHRAARGSRRGGGRRTGRARPRPPRTPPGRARAAPRGPTSGAATATVPGNVTTTAASSSPTSMPSSSASVVITARSSPAHQALLELAPLLRRVARAVGRHLLRERRARPSSQIVALTRRLSTSTPLRDFMKQIVRAPSRTSARPAPRPRPAPSGACRAPRRSAAGSTSRCAGAAPASRPRRSARSPRGPSAARRARPGWRSSPTSSRKRGSVPYAAAMRRSRRSTLATCEPNTPR